jgi:SAM-dependent methyltransferase
MTTTIGTREMAFAHHLEPISRVFGFDRGLCIDRYYIEQFLAANKHSIRGRVLEIAENTYTRKFGGDSVTHSDVLHAEEGNRNATIVADLTQADHIASNRFDCIICTQTLLVIYDVRAAVSTLHRILKPGGVLLATVPGISQISRYDMDRWGDFWRFTTLSARRLFEERFPESRVEVVSKGNVLVAVAFLHGLAAHELEPRELEHHDPDYQVLITVRAEKPGGTD